jgi:hypothetical protein
MTDRDGCVRVHEQNSLRLSDIVAAAQHNRMFSLGIDTGSLKKGHYAKRRTRHERLVAQQERPEVRRVKSVHIFARIHALQHGMFVDMFWQGKLDENTIDRVVFVKLPNLVHQLSSLDRPREGYFPALNPQLFAGSGLHVYVGGRRCILSDKDYRQTRVDTLLVQVLHFPGDFRLNVFRDPCSVNKSSCHVLSSNAASSYTGRGCSCR